MISVSNRIIGLAAVIVLSGCRTTDDSVLLGGESVNNCDDKSSTDVNHFALLTTVSDFTSEAALESAKSQIIEKYKVPEFLQPKIPIEVAEKCGNLDDNTITIRAGINTRTITQSLDNIKALVDSALARPSSNNIDRFKTLMLINKKISAYNAVQTFLGRQGVKLAAIPASGAIKKFYEMRDKMKIALKFSDKAYVLNDGNVTRNMFKKAFVDMGLRTTDMEKVEGNPDMYFAIDLRWETLPRGGNTGQQFVRLYATIAMEDASFATVAATTLEAKGGGVDADAAAITALRSLESIIVSQLLESLIPEETI